MWVSHCGCPAEQHLRLTDSVRTLLATILNNGAKPAHDQFDDELDTIDRANSQAFWGAEDDRAIQEDLKLRITSVKQYLEEYLDRHCAPEDAPLTVAQLSHNLHVVLHVFNGISELTPLLAHLNGTKPPREWTTLRTSLFHDLATALAVLRVRPASPARAAAHARHPDSIVAFVKRLHVELRVAQQIKDGLPDKIAALEERLAKLKDEEAEIASRKVAGQADRDAKKRAAKAAREERAQVNRELMVAKSKLATHLKTMAVVKRLLYVQLWAEDRQPDRSNETERRSRSPNSSRPDVRQRTPQDRERDEQSLSKTSLLHPQEGCFRRAVHYGAYGRRRGW
ncbi:hypothetical protein Rhopal_007384-T1 [Rhodotorula paludigena]|uniref:Uncharacterized protein n=1 Tax=Rhodotorula paludigena TaxID=86838 RepID=A0AAV5GP06_9BASI|nr:hypothetical protein Rhopal_007384-T1 [Rhodotorula paludigena]